jgi:hypothetical protein
VNAARAADIARWVTGAGLAGTAEPELLQAFCARSVAAGLPLAHVNMLIDTLDSATEAITERARVTLKQVAGFARRVSQEIQTFAVQTEEFSARL